VLRFRYAFFAVIFIWGFSSSASAAGKPTKVFFDPWTGYYVGVNVGYGGDASNIDISANDSGTGGGALNGPARRAANTGAIPAYQKPDPHGFFGGFQLGYNWHLMPRWLAGLEADIDFGDVRDSDTRTGSAYIAGGGGNTFLSIAMVTGEQKINWFGTLRPRVGFLVTDNLLVYANGGLAFGHVSSTTTLSETTICTVALGCPVTNTGVGSASSTRVGWTVGGGTEWALNNRWSLKTEYLYVDLGDLTYANSPLTNGGSSIVNTTSVAHFKNNIVRLGLNYKIGPSGDIASEVMAAVPYNWSGFYAGVNAGYGGDVNDIDISAFNSATNPAPGPVARRAAETGAIPPYLKTDPHGFIGGFQLGYNWQFVPRWLVGLEADINFADVRGSDNRTGTATASGGGTTFLPTATVTGDQKMTWFGTVRPRVGFLVEDNLLVYATGGLAFGHISSTTNLSETTCTAPLVCALPNTGAGSASSTRTGWTVGGGTELAVANHWSLKAEYLYVDLGDLTYVNGPLTAGGGASIVNTTSVAHFTNQIVRLGLNYKF
jgi:outer membrane immunogenic protein